MQLENEEIENEEGNIIQQTNFKKVEELESYGVNKTDIQKLKAGGYNTVESIAHSTLRKLIEVKGISEQKALKLKEIIKTNEIVHSGFQTATTRLQSLNELVYISTGNFYNSNRLLIMQQIISI